jgi:hypothetical protein
MEKYGGVYVKLALFTASVAQEAVRIAGLVRTSW